MNSKEFKEILAKVDKERRGFANKASLDTLTSKLPTKLIKRTNEIEQLVKYLLGYKDNQVAPVVSVYGRSGSGKSATVKYVCSNMPEVKTAYANLRKAKTVFGGTNLILNALDQPSLKSAQGLNVAIEKIQESILESISQHKLFVLVLDEFDVLFYDKRGNPSDFVYKLVEMQSDLKAKGCLCMIITISNNVLADYALDDRIKSRIGTSEIFFKPYSKEEVFEILEQRAKEAFDDKINKAVLQRCAELSSLESGDARRSIELLRVGLETALKENKPVTVQHINTASEQLQRDRAEEVLKSLSSHGKRACMTLAVLTFESGKNMHTTMELYDRYKINSTEAVSYRRFSDILTDLENTGILTSSTSSKGRRGYNSEFCLVVHPEIVGKLIDPQMWDLIVQNKREMDADEIFMNPRDPLLKAIKKIEKQWSK